MQDMSEFAFDRELFHGLSTILQGMILLLCLLLFLSSFVLVHLLNYFVDVRDKVKQEKLSFPKAESIKNDNAVGNNATSIIITSFISFISS